MPTADNGQALAALLMASQRQQMQPQYDPATRSRRLAERLMMQSSSQEPVYSAGEGVARALQGTAAGFFAGQADRDEKERQQRTAGLLTDLYNAPDEAARQTVLRGAGDVDTSVISPFMASILAQKIADERHLTKAVADFNALGPATAGGGGGGAPITTAPLPDAAVPEGGFANNVGNIRASNAAWEGKGAPVNGFETFATPEAGTKAAYGNLSAYIQKNPNITVAQAISQWAPPTENNTQQYIQQVAEGTGINPGMALSEVMKDPAMSAQLMDAIIRKEKGGVPPSLNADKLIALSPAAGQTQVAQAPAAAPAPANPPSNLPEISPQAAELERQAQAAAKSGSPEALDRAIALRQKAQETQAAWAAKRAETVDTRAYEQREFDRKEGMKPLTETQGKDAGYADRMVSQGAIIDRLEQQGTNAMGRGLTGTVFGVGVPGGNYAVSPEFRQFKAAKDNWIAAQLRQESGAVIGDKEYADADRQYFPQPGDDAQTIANKAKLRQQATQSMIRAAGDKYKPQEIAPAAPAAGGGLTMDAIDAEIARRRKGQ